MSTLRVLAAVSLVLIASCDVHYNLNGSSHSAGSPPPPPASEAAATGAEPAPAEAEVAPPAPSGERPSRRGDGGGYDEAQQTPDDGQTPTGKAASSKWDGKYVDLSEACDAAAVFDPKGKDDQVVRVERWGYTGFVCPGTCANREPLVVANGKATFAMLWVDDLGAHDDRPQKLSVHRRRYTVPLVETDGSVAVGKTVQSTTPSTWSYHDSVHTSNQALTVVVLGIANDAHAGYGRTGLFDIRVGRDGKFAAGNDAASCATTISRTDFKLGDGGSDEDPGEAAAGRCKHTCTQNQTTCGHSCKGALGESGCLQTCQNEWSACRRAC